MNQRIVKNCFSRPLNIGEYLSVLRDTGHAPAIQSCEEFENLWESNEIVDGIDLY